MKLTEPASPAGEISPHVRVGLALSGGGGRGLAQIGVLKVLERERVPIHLIAGTSVGSVVGGLYATLVDAGEVERRVLEMLESPEMGELNLQRVLQAMGRASVEDDPLDLPQASGSEASQRAGAQQGLLARAQSMFRRLYASHAALSRESVLKGERVLQVFRGLFEERTFDDVRIPFAAVAVDLERGCEAIITRGPLAHAVAASSAVAGVFPPVVMGGRKLVDGGYTSPVPIDATQTLGANVVIAVDVSMTRIDCGALDNGVEIAMRSSEISLLALEREQLRRADVIISARGRARHWSDYSQPHEAIAAGEAAAHRALDNVRAAITDRARMFI